MIYTQFQYNRNPFIDYPELAELIFGKDSTNATFSPSLVRQPLNLTLAADPNGARRATLAWTNPATRIDGQSAALTAIVIQRNGVTIHTINNPPPAQKSRGPTARCRTTAPTNTASSPFQRTATA